MLLAAAVVVGLDQLTKALVVDSIEVGERNEVLPFLDFVHVQNDGVAFGFLGDSSQGLVLRGDASPPSLSLSAGSLSTATARSLGSRSGSWRAVRSGT